MGFSPQENAHIFVYLAFWNAKSELPWRQPESLTEEICYLWMEAIRFHSVPFCANKNNFAFDRWIKYIPSWRMWRLDFLQISSNWASLVPQWERIHLPMQETRVRSLGWEDPLEKEMATHSSIFLPGKFHGQRNLSGSSVLQRVLATKVKWLCSCER